MDQVRWEHRPSLQAPVVVCAFEGWNDAGDGSTGALRHLIEAWGAERIATVDAEEFFDFTAVRPRVRLVEGEQLGVRWPQTDVYSAHIPGTDRDALLVLGTEPQLRWQTFCRQVTDVAEALGSGLLVTLGALLAEVPHTRPHRVIGSASDCGTGERLGLNLTSYEGPTGIVGVLHDAAIGAGLDSVSLWVEVPTYVPAATSPKAALALVEHLAQLLEVPIDTGELRLQAMAYEQRIDELVAEDEDSARYVRRLEAEADGLAVPCDDGCAFTPEDLGEMGRLLEDLERYLREPPPEVTPPGA